jgi:hypothetical protein
VERYNSVGGTTAATACTTGRGGGGVTVQQTGTAPDGHGEDPFPTGARVLVRDEVRPVRNSSRTEHDGTETDIGGVSGSVRDQEAVSFTDPGRPSPCESLRRDGT